MKNKKIIGRIILGAFLVSLIPYRVEEDKETGTLEIRSLLWALRKTPHKEDEGKDEYVFAIPPSGLNYEARQTEEKPAEKPSAEEPAEAAAEE